ncbi:tRNA (uracil-5-)-methyltransferase homolog A [Geodia barretti]|uniref:tRNA (Uracil-5-)-methyltransferase homolog A n=1 Tax=Geodia barretti TaxID=519541 RepID=A0AA35WWI2_GEOBA|nr:tRNA (uracil-5-)-methyltransferase homolog A [Geodia barretti]
MAARFLARRLAIVVSLSRHRIAHTKSYPTTSYRGIKPAATPMIARKMTSPADSRAGADTTTAVVGVEEENEEVGQGEGVRSEVGEGGGDGGEGVSGEEDKYQYLQRGFTSEIFKIEIQNIPKYIGYGELKKKLEKLGLKPVKIKKPQRFQHQPHCFVTFRCEEDREFALEALKGVVWKNKTITAKVAAPSVDPLYRQRNKRKTAADSGAEGAAKRARIDQEQSQLSLRQRLDKVVTPLLGTAYESQLATKAAQMRLALQKAAYLIQKEGSNPGGEFARQVDLHRGMMCELEPILASPLQTGYRNKVELTVGTQPDNTPVVGFRLGSYEDGEFTVVSPEHCAHIPERVKQLGQVCCVSKRAGCESTLISFPGLLRRHSRL